MALNTRKIKIRNDIVNQHRRGKGCRLFAELSTRSSLIIPPSYCTITIKNWTSLKRRCICIYIYSSPAIRRRLMRISCLWASPLQCVQLLLQSASFLRPDAHSDRRHCQPGGFDRSINHREGLLHPWTPAWNHVVFFHITRFCVILLLLFFFTFSVQPLVGWIILLGIWRMCWTFICFLFFVCFLFVCLFFLSYPYVTPDKSLKELLNTKMTYFFLSQKQKIHFKKIHKIWTVWDGVVCSSNPGTEFCYPVFPYVSFFCVHQLWIMDHRDDALGLFPLRQTAWRFLSSGALQPVVSRMSAACGAIWCNAPITHSSLSMFLFVFQIGGVSWKKKKKLS